MTASAQDTAGLKISARPPGKPLLFKEHWTSAFSDQMRLFTVQLVCSGGSSAVAKTVVAPLERIKILRQVQHMAVMDTAIQYGGIRDALRRLPTREGGVQALWRGNGANVLRLAPDVAFRFVVHDQFRVMFAPLDGSPPGVAEKLAAGAATGILKTLLFYPLDVCRTRITADQSIHHHSGLTATLPPQATAASTWSPPSSAVAAATGGSHAAMWSAPTASNVPHVAVAASGPAASPFGSAVAVTAAAPATPSLAAAGRPGPVSSQVPSPGGRTYPTVRSCLVSTLQSEGVRGLYRGALLSMGGVAPYLAISFTMYDELRKRLPSDRESTSAIWYPVIKMGCGAAAAVSAQTVVYPLDTVRRCMQMNGAAGQAVRYTSASDCLRQLLRTHGGVQALYRGCLTNCLKTSLGAPVHFVMYDAIKSAVQALDPTTGVASPL